MTPWQAKTGEKGDKKRRKKNKRRTSFLLFQIRSAAFASVVADCTVLVQISSNTVAVAFVVAVLVPVAVAL